MTSADIKNHQTLISLSEEELEKKRKSSQVTQHLIESLGKNFLYSDREYSFKVLDDSLEERYDAYKNNKER